MENNGITIYSATLSAKSELEKNGLTLAVTDGKSLYSSTARGVRPLLDLYENQVNVSGFCACDKVVGKGASVLYALLKIKQVYAITASKMAVETLEKHGISVICENVVERILNRDKTGFCPIESAVCDEDELDKALEKIYQTLNRLKEKK